MYDGVGGVRDHIIKLKHYFNKANEMKVELSEKFLKWLILEFLPTSFDAVKLTYNALKEEWTLKELMSIGWQRGGFRAGRPLPTPPRLFKAILISVPFKKLNGARRDGAGQGERGKMIAKTRKEKIDRLRWNCSWGKPIKAVKSDRGDKQCQALLNRMGLQKKKSHIVEYAPSKSVLKTPYELWSGKKPSHHHSMFGDEHEYDGYDVSDPVTYQEAIHCPQFTSWKEAMDDEMNFMYLNGVGIWSNCHMVVNQLDATTSYGYQDTFLNGDLDEDVYMEQPTGFAKVGKEDLVCKLQ
ncbi:hypothetical protein CK203_053613 [Vitis vinifera]|uniref:Retrovirus-related Pol polyprotein from transposon TNT 1-94 n=1 Tax=Vitis vinifera TaxID=29760 RepID=A0A438GJL7_VITVI|nr:hypothetical protein CK203_053613 [Vitis vinifera]